MDPPSSGGDSNSRRFMSSTGRLRGAPDSISGSSASTRSVRRSSNASGIWWPTKAWPSRRKAVAAAMRDGDAWMSSCSGVFSPGIDGAYAAATGPGPVRPVPIRVLWMHFSVWPNASQTWSEIVGVARHAEQTGWDGVWIADHFMPNSDDVSGPVHECWALISGLAAVVPRVRIGALVSGNTYRHPAVLAKVAVTADHISGGRIVLGLGAGWQENEHRAYGIDYFDTKGRLERFGEACELLKGLLTSERTTFEGKHYTL